MVQSIIDNIVNIILMNIVGLATSRALDQQPEAW